MEERSDEKNVAGSGLLGGGSFHHRVRYRETGTE
jgi:hypothetical protein